VRATDGSERTIAYDRLLIATGAESARPLIQGLDTPGVFFLRWMVDSFAIKQYLDVATPRRAVIIGGGYIGLEMADALTVRGMAVTLLEFSPEILTTLDPALGSRIRAELTARGVAVVTGKGVARIERQDHKLSAITASGERWPADLVLVAAGARIYPTRRRSPVLGTRCR
jgi:NADPH-dependent 2,4-dienoyl-CoA reductase/sulfur reductase-like enzyme